MSEISPTASGRVAAECFQNFSTTTLPLSNRFNMWGFFDQIFFRSTPLISTDTNTRNLLPIDDFVTLLLVVLVHVFQIVL